MQYVIWPRLRLWQLDVDSPDGNYRFRARMRGDDLEFLSPEDGSWINVATFDGTQFVSSRATPPVPFERLLVVDPLDMLDPALLEPRPMVPYRDFESDVAGDAEEPIGEDQ